MARPYLEIQELSSMKCHSFILTPISHKSAVVIFRQQLKKKPLIPIILLSLQCSLSEMSGP